VGARLPLLPMLYAGLATQWFRRRPSVDRWLAGQPPELREACYQLHMTLAPPADALLHLHQWCLTAGAMELLAKLLGTTHVVTDDYLSLLPHGSLDTTASTSSSTSSSFLLLPSSF